MREERSDDRGGGASEYFLTAARVYTATIALGACATISSGCNPEFSGLEDMLDGSPTYANLPGRRVAEGLFHRPIVDGTDKSGPYVVAFDVDGPARLAIVPLKGGEPCRTTAANVFQTSLYPPSSNLDLVMPYVEPAVGDQPQRLHFVDTKCRDVVDPIGSSSLPLSPNWLFEDPEGYLVLTSDHRLIFAEPWNRKERTIATDVDRVSITQNRIWSIEAGTVVVRDYKFEKLASFGTAVTELAVTTSYALRAAYVQGGSLYVVKQDLGEPKLVDDKDVCNVDFPESWSGYGMSYFSPCTDRNLVLRESMRQTSHGIETVDTRYDIASGALTDTPELRILTDKTRVFYLTGEDGASLGTLWSAELGGTAEKIGDSAQLDAISMPVDGQWRALVDRHEDASGVARHTIGRLVQWRPGGAVREITTDVAEIHGSAALVHFDGVTGDAVLLDGSGRSVLLAKGVPRNGMLTDPVGNAVLSNFDGTTGTLLVAPPESFAYEAIESGVPLRGLSFVENLNAVAYYYDYDPQTFTGTLAIRVLDTADIFDANVRTSEWSEQFWPEPGILYVVPDGDRRGIWFAGLY